MGFHFSDASLWTRTGTTISPDATGDWLSFPGANGQSITFGWSTEVTVIADAASSVTVMSIPANCTVLGIPVYVTVAIPTAANFSVDGNTAGGPFTTANTANTAGASNAGTLACPYHNGAAQLIKITPNATPDAATGRVRVTLYYYSVTAPTS